MATLYTSSPKLAGCTTPSIIHLFSVSISSDGDAWPSISYITDNTEDYRECGGRFRSPMIGGSASDAVYFALKDLHNLIVKDDLHTAKGSQFEMIGPLQRPRARPRRERHMDDGCGYLAVEVKRNGNIIISMRPLNDEEYGLDKPVDITLPPTTPYQHSYTGLIALWRALGEDNRKLGNFYGHHS